MLLSLISVPIVLSLPFIVAITILLRDADTIHYVLYIILTTASFSVGEAIFMWLFQTPVYSIDSLRWLFSTIAQGYAALIGILGSFLIYHLQTLKDVGRQIRKEAVRSIGDFDYSKILVDEMSFQKYLKKLPVEKHTPQIKYAQYFLGVIREEKQQIDHMIHNQFIMLFASVFLSMVILLVVDGFYVVYGLVFRFVVYLVFSISSVALISTVRSIFTLTKTGNYY